MLVYVSVGLLFPSVRPAKMLCGLSWFGHCNPFPAENIRLLRERGQQLHG